MKLVLTLAAAVALQVQAHSHARVDAPLAEGGDIFETSRNYLQRRLQEELGASEAHSEVISKRFIERARAQGVVEAEDWHAVHETVYNNEWEQNVTVSTYTSPAMRLSNGQAHFTLNPLFKIPVPKGDYVLVNAQWDIIDGNGQAVPLTELYNHHWLIGTNSNVDPLGMCEEDLFWGGGAEFRKLDYRNPGGYGIARIGASGSCGANLHFIRVDGLKTHWDGLNDPKGDMGAAIKSCGECGYAPGRDAGVCQPFFDGSFCCCFTGSRCPVEKKLPAKDYHLKGTFEWTRNMTGLKQLRIHMLDVGGAPRIEKEQFMFGTEWNVDSYLSNHGANTYCNATVCNSTNSVVVGEQKSLENGWCAGELIWAYNHMHAGAIEGIMSVNGKEYCRSVPHVGTDPHNKPLNEKGFVVDISTCVDKRTKGNNIFLKDGDVVTVTTLYDVDPKSQRNAPLPGGKHGGIMALFFGAMHCNPGTYGEKYVCKNSQCIGVKKELSFMKTYKDYGSCQAACGLDTQIMTEEQEQPEAYAAVARVTDNAEATLIPQRVRSPEIGKVSVVWNECHESQEWKINSLSPSSFPLNGGKTSIVVEASVPTPMDGANYTIKLASGLMGMTFFDFSGDVCEPKKEYSLFGQMALTWEGFDCPIKAGNLTVNVGLNVGLEIPSLAGSTTTTVVIHGKDGKVLNCVEVITEGFEKEYDALV